MISTDSSPILKEIALLEKNVLKLYVVVITLNSAVYGRKAILRYFFKQLFYLSNFKGEITICNISFSFFFQDLKRNKKVLFHFYFRLWTIEINLNLFNKNSIILETLLAILGKKIDFSVKEFVNWLLQKVKNKKLTNFWCKLCKFIYRVHQNFVKTLEIH